MWELLKQSRTQVATDWQWYQVPCCPLSCLVGMSILRIGVNRHSYLQMAFLLLYADMNRLFPRNIVKLIIWEILMLKIPWSSSSWKTPITCYLAIDQGSKMLQVCSLSLFTVWQNLCVVRPTLSLVLLCQLALAWLLVLMASPWCQPLTGTSNRLRISGSDVSGRFSPVSVDPGCSVLQGPKA